VLDVAGDQEACTPPWASHAARVVELQPGLRLHADDAVDAVDATAQGCCLPGLHLVFLLEGGLDVCYGERRVVLDTATGPSPRDTALPRCGQARSFMLNVVEPAAFTRQVRRGRYARRVSLCVSREWLQQLQACSCSRLPAPLRSLLDGHLALQTWQPTARAVALAEQLVRPPDCAPMMQRLYQHSRLLDLLAEALAPLQAAEAAPVPTAAMSRRLRDLREFLNSEAANELSLDDIAGRMGMSVNALQKQFRRAYGTTVFGFVRESRLQRARVALERDGLSIKQAAALAGYGSAANFATAFGRRFGLTPKDARRAGQR
jgi:AraC-like DNA-binding protein